MSSTDPSSHDPQRLRPALRAVRQRYWRQVRARPWLTLTAVLLPGLGNIFVFYVPPLAVAHVLGRIVREPTVPAIELLPAVLLLGGAWLVGEIVWRVSGLLLSRAEVYGMEALYIEAMDELAAKHVGFFHENFAGSLTKKALGYARR